MQQILSMILRLFIGRAVNGGIDLLARGGKDPATMTPEERQSVAKNRQTARQAKQAIRLMRQRLSGCIGTCTRRAIRLSRATPTQRSEVAPRRSSQCCARRACWRRLDCPAPRVLVGCALRTEPADANSSVAGMKLPLARKS